MKTDKLTASAQVVLENLNDEIAERENELKLLTTARQALGELYGNTVPSPQSTVPSPKPGPREPKPARQRPKFNLGPSKRPDVAAAYRAEMHPETVAAARPGKQPSAETVRVMAAMRLSPQPFTAVALRLASNADNMKTVSNALARAQAKGWITKVKRGEYERPGAFPAETPAAD